MSVIAVIAVFAVLVFAAAVPVIIGIYVYQDARRRGMQGLLWAFAAAAAPALIGLIVYLLVRGNHSDLRCPRCGGAVKEAFTACPGCGTRLRASCPNCAMPVEPDWNVCPKCALPLVDARQEVQAPVRATDKSIGKVLAVVLVIPILVIAILVLGLTVEYSGGASSFSVVPVEDYMEQMKTQGGASEAAIAEEVSRWLASLEAEPNHAYALRYEYAAGSENQHFFLVYVPGAEYKGNAGMDQSSSIFGTTLALELCHAKESCYVFNIVSSADKAPNLKILLDGKRIPCSVTAVEYNPTLFIISS